MCRLGCSPSDLGFYSSSPSGWLSCLGCGLGYVWDFYSARPAKGRSQTWSEPSCTDDRQHCRRELTTNMCASGCLGGWKSAEKRRSICPCGCTQNTCSPDPTGPLNPPASFKPVTRSMQWWQGLWAPSRPVYQLPTTSIDTYAVFRVNDCIWPQVRVEFAGVSVVEQGGWWRSREQVLRGAAEGTVAV